MFSFFYWLHKKFFYWLHTKEALERNTVKSSSRQILILEPILTPSAIIDTGDENPGLTIDIPCTDPFDYLDNEPDFPNSEFPSELDLFEVDDEADDLVVPVVTNLEPRPLERGIFEVGESGNIEIEYLYDGGAFEGELTVFSLEGMESHERGSPEFIQEAAQRSLSESELGHIVISDAEEGAKFEGGFGEGNFNQGEYQGTKTFTLGPGDRFGMMFVPNGKVQDVLENPSLEGANRPLFSMATDDLPIGQIADITGDGQIIGFEDMPVDADYDRDHNDVIISIRGARVEAIDLDDIITEGQDWRDTELGQEILHPEDDFGSDPLDDPEVTLGDISELIVPTREPWDVEPILTDAIDGAVGQLEELVQYPDFPDQIHSIIGEEIDLESVREIIDNLKQKIDSPPILILMQEELGDANSFFDSESNVIHLSYDFIEANIENNEEVSNTLLKELGNYLDFKLEEIVGEGESLATQSVGESGIDIDFGQKTALSFVVEAIILERIFGYGVGNQLGYNEEISRKVNVKSINFLQIWRILAVERWGGNHSKRNQSQSTLEVKILETLYNSHHTEFSQRIVDALQKGTIPIIFEELESRMKGSSNEFLEIHINKTMNMSDILSTIIHEGRHHFDKVDGLIPLKNPGGEISLRSELRATIDAANFAFINNLKDAEEYRLHSVPIEDLIMITIEDYQLQMFFDDDELMDIIENIKNTLWDDQVLRNLSQPYFN